MYTRGFIFFSNFNTFYLVVSINCFIFVIPNLIIMIPTKTEKEQKLFDQYKKWLNYDGLIPQYIIDNFKKDVEKIK